MVIVEGPDGAGKTTLIEKLSKHWNLPVAPRVVSKDAEAMVDLKGWVEQNVQIGPQNLIFDRHRLISEPIYGPILRRWPLAEGFTDVGWLQWMMAEFYRSHPLIIFCLPPFDTVMENVRGDMTNRVVWDTIPHIYQAYAARAAMEVARAPREVMIYDYTSDGRELDPLACFDSWTRLIDRRKQTL